MRKSHVFNDKNGINSVKPKSSGASEFIIQPKHHFLLKTVKYYNEDNKKEDKPQHCGYGPFTYTRAAREVQEHAGQSKTPPTVGCC